MLPHKTARQTAITFALLAMVVGCTNFDREDRIEDTRVLAIKTSPPEILYSPLYLTPAAQRPFPLPPIDVNVQVFAYDPRGGRTRTTVQICPEDGTDASCRLFDPGPDIAAEPAAARDDVRGVLEPRVIEGNIADDALPVGRITPDRFDYRFTSNVIDYFIPDGDDGTPQFNVFPLLPRVVVQVESLDQADQAVWKERAYKRIPLAVDLTSPDLPPNVIADIVQGLGFTLCTSSPLDDEPFVEGNADCLAARVPNTNPAFVGFKLEPDAEKLTEDYLYGDSPELARNSLMIADPGAVIAITPVFTEGTVERYQVLSFDIKKSKLILLNRQEDFGCNWYSTRGDLSQTLTAIQFSTTLGVTWALPQDAKKGDRDSLYLVILDQRGGVAFGEITVEYR